MPDVFIFSEHQSIRQQNYTESIEYQNNQIIPVFQSQNKWFSGPVQELYFSHREEKEGKVLWKKPKTEMTYFMALWPDRF